MPKTAVKLLLLGAVVLAPAVARAQTAPAFDGATLDVSSEWVGQDRGDGSGSYRLTNRVTDGRAGWTIEHELAAERGVDLETSSTETLKVFQGDEEMASAGSDPAALGQWSNPAVAYAIPFGVEFNTDPRKSYRPRQKQVEELARSAAPEARVSTRSASDGRTSATIEIPGVHPVAELARQFVGIRQALRDADVGLAKLQIKGQADTSASAEAASAQ